MVLSKGSPLFPYPPISSQPGGKATPPLLDKWVATQGWALQRGPGGQAGLGGGALGGLWPALGWATAGVGWVPLQSQGRQGNRKHGAHVLDAECTWGASWSLLSQALNLSPKELQTPSTLASD